MTAGSLGQGLPCGAGIALAGRRLDTLPYQVRVLCGDSEMAEGPMGEAPDKAAYYKYKLGNLTAIVDVNRRGRRGPTEREAAPPSGNGTWPPSPGSSSPLPQSAWPSAAMHGSTVLYPGAATAAAALTAGMAGTPARVIDLYSVKPVDQATLADAAAAADGRLVIAEDHYPQGGLGAAARDLLKD
ncbi:MAG: transketolase C-terminal domain-containing protein [Streptosporangiaceae bacterium]